MTTSAQPPAGGDPDAGSPDLLPGLVALVERSPDMIIVVNRHGTIMWTNSATENTFGTDRSTTVGTAVLELIHPDDEPRARVGLEQLRAGGDGSTPIVVRARHADGTWLPIEVTATNLLGQPPVNGIVLTARDLSERLSLERRVHELEHSFTAAFRHSPIGRTLVDLQGRWLLVNDAFVRMVHRDADALIGTLGIDLVHPEDQQRVRDELAVLGAGGAESATVETRLVRPDGEIVWVRFTVWLVVGDDGRITHYGSDVTDITEVRAARDAEDRARRDFEALVEQASDIITVLDADGTWRSSSGAVARLLGYPPGFDPDGGFLSLLHPDDVAAAGVALDELRHGTRGATDTLIVRVRAADGTYHALETVGRDLTDDPAVRGIVLSSRDVTERLDAEEQLRVADARLRALLEQSSDVIVLMDQTGAIDYISPAYETIFGRATDDVEGTDGLFRIHPDDLPRVSATLASLFTDPGRRVNITLRVRHADGSYRHVEAIGQNRTDDPAVGGVVWNIRDITNRVRTEAELRATEQRLAVVVEHSSDLIVVLDEEARVSYLSPAGERLFGRSPQDGIGKQGIDLVHPDDVERVAATFAKLVDSPPGAIDMVTCRVVHNDGSYRWVEAIGRNLLDDPALPGIVLNVRDITDRVESESSLRKAQARFAALVDHASDLITVNAPDGTVTYLSPSSATLLGYAPDELVGTPAQDLIHPDDIADIEGEAIAQFGGKPVAPIEYRARHRDGSWRVFEAILTNLFDEPGVEGVVTHGRDVTERRAAERRAADLVEILEAANELVVVSDPGGRIVYANRSSRTLLGAREDRYVGELSSERSRERLRTEIMPVVRRRGAWSGELELLDQEGGPIPVTATVQAQRDESGTVVRIATVAHDISELKAAQRRLEFEATHDALTALPNRALFRELGDRAMARASRISEALAVLFLDLDGFKLVNDSYGHDTGDVLLGLVARRLREAVRAGDVVARLGGDEFVILCEHPRSETQMLELSTRIIEQISQPFVIDGHTIHVGVSVGIAFSKGADAGIGDLIRDADVALYRAKNDGRGRAQLFDETLLG
ncbi:MAG TPA: PAS domain S-box protein [Acidimicrobiia bacterium]|nr:PAS domain S-box protein [Acidimicrobiia bacterium]